MGKESQTHAKVLQFMWGTNSQNCIIRHLINIK